MQFIIYYREIKWHPPDVDWLKVNMVQLWGILTQLLVLFICDYFDHWINGFTRKIGETSIVAIVLWTLRDGPQLALTMDFTNLVIELDAMLVISFLNDSVWELTLPYFSLLMVPFQVPPLPL